MPTQLTSLFGSRISSAYNSLRGDLGVPQTATETIDKLVDRIQTSAGVEDRRTAVLGLKGLSRDWREEVGDRALPSLVAVLQYDAPNDVDIAKATLETLTQLCEVPDKPTRDDVGLRFTDLFLSDPQPLHSLLSLLSNSPSFYPRFYALQFLSQLLTSRAPVAQACIMSSPPPGVEGILSVLDAQAPKILRNEALLLLPVMLSGNADLQKIVAFSGAFERLFDIIRQENGVNGGIVVQDALTVVGCLLRFNVSNQNYFRELSLIPAIPTILGFPPSLPLDQPAPHEFALQFWREQKINNVGLVLGLIRMLVADVQSAMVAGGVTRCLLELALASNAPNGLKSQALNTLTPILTSSVQNQTLLSTLGLSPLVAVHADEEHPNGGFVRLPTRPAVEVLVSAVVEGDLAAGGRGLRGRAAGVNMFEAYVSGNEDARIGILTSMIPSDSLTSPTAGAIILSGLLQLPTSDPEIPFDPYRPLFACLLLGHLVRDSEHAKKLAREITLSTTEEGDQSALDAEADEDRVSLIQLVVGNLMMASREQAECANRAAKEGKVVGATEEEDWSRVMVGYLVLLCTWLWDSPKTVKEFLSESANLQVLIQPITQPTGIDPLVQGLSAFLLGVCYEFNREPGEITRATLHPILHSRIGPDQFVSRMARLREDPRFRAVQPDAFDTEGAPDVPAQGGVQVAQDGVEDVDEGLELWFDWAFVDFWKNHYYTIQRAIAVDPDAVRGAGSSDDSETAAIIMSLRQKLKAQIDEVMGLQSKLAHQASEHKNEKEILVGEVQLLSEQLAQLSSTQKIAVSREDYEALAKQLAEEEQRTAALQADAGAAETLRDEVDKLRSSHSGALQELEAKLKTADKQAEELKGKVAELQQQVEADEKVLEEERQKRAEQEKEHEDLLVLLEELSQKRKKDKERMREQGLEVSDAEDEEGDEE
ncbi:hypothetical protein TREMEDRAFT_45944 [Tremella mesenterica DSM 1558]|uniref:uncharacterized protein n=1 Tax=Tremella mesenterica (strain ATCC 24925 / CBS 8224 / DSM 1558 / NBRC 9311 / NRRL Y-6157 / RJB 2259-6 / UBC 559-6) TaxID=578456 RepID=UPI00032BECDD|nr:uncharacterized protein TREMEDRAFT_45944 [Tremella mesenterica DSM 1558]EIW65889.1 hypothetical protein TREMEDRAFT_45944 [Tremella mesenterica DSM 1558]